MLDLRCNHARFDVHLQRGLLVSAIDFSNSFECTCHKGQTGVCDANWKYTLPLQLFCTHVLYDLARHLWVLQL